MLKSLLVVSASFALLGTAVAADLPKAQPAPAYTAPVGKMPVGKAPVGKAPVATYPTK